MINDLTSQLKDKERKIENFKIIIFGRKNIIEKFPINN